MRAGSRLMVSRVAVSRRSTESSGYKNDTLANLERAKQLLTESGDDGRAIVMLDPTDQDLLQKAVLVVTPGLREAGATVQALDRSPAAAERRLHGFIETYYGVPAPAILARQAAYAGSIEGGAEWLQRWIDAGVRHFCLRFAGGDQLAQVDETASRLLPRLRRG